MPKRIQGLRDKILNCALKEFAAKGFHACSFQHLANELSVSQSAVMNYFKSKDLLVEELIDIIGLRNSNYVTGLDKIDAPALQSIFNYIEGNIIWADENPKDMQIIMTLFYLSGISTKYSKNFSPYSRKCRN